MIDSNINEEVSISIIIPCYNASAYLGRLSNCIDQQLKSCLGENNQIVEFVLVNDGSKDDTLQQLLRIKEKYPLNITVVDQPNMGVSAARNTGIKHARGTWIGFLDSDDLLKEGALSHLLQQIVADDFDMLIYDFRSVADVDQIPTIVLPKTNRIIYSGNSKEYYLKFLPIVVWRMLYRASLIKETKMIFQDITIGEDTLFNFEIFMLGVRVKHIDEILCFHIERENSLTTNVDANYVRKIILSVLRIQEVYNDYINNSKLSSSIVAKIDEHRKRQTSFVFSKLVAATSCFPLEEIKEVSLQLESLGALPLHAVTNREHFINFCFKNPFLIILLFYLRRMKRMLSRSVKNTN